MLIMHISDTPSPTYGYIYKLVKKLAPGMVIHTGDLADEVKLELKPSLIYRYRRHVVPFLNRLSELAKLLVVPGNHDDLETIQSVEGVSTLLSGQTIEIDHAVFTVSHWYMDDWKGDFLLYGHNLTPGTLPGELNGVLSINLIDTITGSVDKIKYPYYTDSLRFPSRRINLP